MKAIPGLLLGLTAAVAVGTVDAGTVDTERRDRASDVPESIRHLNDFQVVELRRYTVSDGERKHFATYFDTYFPEAFEQLGSMVFGQFYDRTGPTRFTWLRGFKDINARAVVNAAFYYGPVWREHRKTLNAILPDSDNVLLLRPLLPDTGVDVLPAVNPVTEEDGAHGIVVAEIFAVNKGSEETFARQAQTALAQVHGTGVRPAGILVTLDVTNNFPQLPVRTDGPFLVSLSLVQDEATLEKTFAPRMDKVVRTLTDSRMLRGAPERLVLDPTPRSRLRWLPGTPK
jgi:hypothetical protein